MTGSRSKPVPFKQVDVFTDVPFKGNPVAVVLDGGGLTTAQMQSIANWTNLSETTFVCAPTHADADYRLRIFTPRSELPFAGHPTIGSAWAVLQHGLLPKTPGRMVQECGKSLIALRMAGQSLFFALPEPAFTAPGDAQLAAVAAALGIPVSEIVLCSIVDAGAVWLTLQLPSAEKVIALKPDMALLAALGNALFVGVSVFGLHEACGSTAVEVRSFAPACGIPEDPVFASITDGIRCKSKGAVFEYPSQARMSCWWFRSFISIICRGLERFIHSDINLLCDSGAGSGSARDPHILLCMLRSLRAGLPHPQTARYDFCRYV